MGQFLRLLLLYNRNQYRINIHIDNAGSVSTRDLSSCLDGFGLQQCINSPTHLKDHTPD